MLYPLWDYILSLKQLLSAIKPGLLTYYQNQQSVSIHVPPRAVYTGHNAVLRLKFSCYNRKTNLDWID